MKCLVCEKRKAIIYFGLLYVCLKCYGMLMERKLVATKNHNNVTTQGART